MRPITSASSGCSASSISEIRAIKSPQRLKGERHSLRTPRWRDGQAGGKGGRLGLGFPENRENNRELARIRPFCALPGVDPRWKSSMLHAYSPRNRAGNLCPNREFIHRNRTAI